ncbi:winged helix-turn-helix domain-containing protein [Streptomyces sp. NPDC006610]|jgi:DNA-binding transcriptional ArsR family regulator|uniref:ArsR/SmtB family transcription factor n=1 Tax=Streptomyces sp. NPDC006610 TaxID=3154584 RepID=UPI0033AEDD25
MTEQSVLSVGPIEHMHVSLSRHPGVTLLSVITNAFGPRSHGMPPAWRHMVRSAAPPGAAETMSGILNTGHPWLPDSLAFARTLAGGGATSVEDELDLVDADALLADIALRFPGAVPRHWRAIADDAERFVGSYRALARTVWDAFGPVWRQAGRLHDREAERIGAALLTGAADAVINTLGASVTYADGQLRLPHAYPCPLTRQNQRRLILVPLASGHSACTYSAEDEELVWVGYPLPGLGRLTETAPPAEADTRTDRLASLFGPVRATILRQARLRPSTSEIARQARVAVSTVTYHGDRLAKAGLVERRRHGQEVRLVLTDRGVGLLDLFD